MKTLLAALALALMTGTASAGTIHTDAAPFDPSTSSWVFTRAAYRAPLTPVTPWHAMVSRVWGEA
jgi:hypothetical protein